MSKKKSTMSLKDFHGGSIPSDLPLPSSPGVTARAGSDRNLSTNWGNNLIRPDQRTQAKSLGLAVYNFDEKASFLSRPVAIGRNFDEDERKPLDGVSGPRRTVSDDGFDILAPIRQELKPDKNSVLQSLSSGASLSLLGVKGATYCGVNGKYSIGNDGHSGSKIQNSSGNGGQSVSNSYPNAWGVRKEVMGVGETRRSSVMKLAQASAVEKVSLGMWQAKTPGQLLPHFLYSSDNNVADDVNVIGEKDDYDVSKGEQAERIGQHLLYARDNIVANGVNVVGEKDDNDASWGDQVERSGACEDGRQDGGREFPKYEGERPQTYTQEVWSGANIDESPLQSARPSELSERPKLKLLPRSKPLEMFEDDYRQKPVDIGKVKHVNELHENANEPKLGPAVAEGGSQPVERPVERPKLNLKPRSQPLEQSDGSLEGERTALFGGARPRELVLKERGIDDIAINKLDLNHSPNRVNFPKSEAMLDRSVVTAPHSPRSESLGIDRSIGKAYERKDHRMDHDKADVQRRNWRNDNWSSNNAEKLQQQQQDRRPEPDTWRKPIEELKSASPDASGIHHTKVASALELAQAFTKSVSYPKTPDQYPGQRGVPGRNNKIPFSRLTDTHDLHSAPSTRHHINGF